MSISTRQIGLACGNPRAVDVKRDQQRAENPRSGGAEDHLRADRDVVDRADRSDRSREPESPRQQRRAGGPLAHFRHRLHAQPHRLEVHDVEQGDVADHRRNECVPDDFRIRNPDVLNHQECRGAHHRRHDLSVDGRRRLDRRRLDTAVAGLLHQRNREDAAGDDVADRRARDQAVQCRRHDRHFRRSAAHVAQQREAHLHHVIAATGAIEQRAEQHEHEDERHRNAEGDAKHALGDQPHVRNRARNRRTFVRNHIGQIGAGQHVEKKNHGKHRHRQTDRAPRRLEQQQNADDADDDVELRRRTGPRRKLVVEQVKVAGGERAGEREDPIEHRHVVARRSLARPETQETPETVRSPNGSSAPRCR